MGSCQFLAQNTHPYASSEKGRTALLERLCQRMSRSEVATDHPAASPPDHARDCRPFLEQPHQTIALSAPPRGGHPPQAAFAPEQQRMRQTREEQDPVRGVPLVLPPFGDPECLCLLTKGCCNDGAAVVGLRQCHGLQVRPGGEQAGIVVAPCLLGWAHPPRARGAPAAMGAQDGSHVAPWTRRGWPGAKVLAHLGHAAMVAEFGHHLLPTTPKPVEDRGGPTAPLQAAHHLGPPLAAPPERRFAR